MKPHEEEWTAEPIFERTDLRRITTTNSSGQTVVVAELGPAGKYLESPEMVQVRAKLAAQAPAMARTLLALYQESPDKMPLLRELLLDAGVIRDS